MMELFEISKGADRHLVILKIWNTSSGWVGSLTGGESPHVGGVVLAVPRPSLTGKGTSCDMWLSPVPGHKDLEVAAPMAKELCSRLSVPISLTAGIHVDNAEAEDIGIIADNCKALLSEFFKLIDFQ